MIADYIVNHQAEFWIIVGFVLLGVEVVTGFSLGVFLFAGPSGVGKTETALGIADLLFGGERFMTVVNSWHKPSRT